jgi:general transcription factor 3C polypeptide 5 (transcription factor C subunit 1)
LPFIYDPLSLQDTCEPHSGWYRPLAFELIKALLRVRYAHLRDKGVPVENDEGCNELVDAYNKAVVGDDKDGAEVFIRRLAAGRRAQNTRT